ncbi:MAG: hypothetical protein ABIZ52_00205 [Candidatus Limnocylindrales bacterium]
MRSFFGFLAFVTGLIVLVAAFAVPAFVAPAIATEVRNASPFGDQPLDVQVDVNAIGLIRGFVSEIRVSGADLERVISGGISLVVFGQRVEVAVGVQDGAFVVPDLLGAGTFEILAPQPDDPWRLTGSAITPTELKLTAEVDTNKLLGER